MAATTTNMRGTRRLRSAPSSCGQLVVSVTSTASDTLTATRLTISAAPMRPCWVIPTSWPNHVPRGTTIDPGVTRLSVAGSTTTAVKIGTNSHTRATNRPTGTHDAHASTRVPTYI